MRALLILSCVAGCILVAALGCSADNDRVNVYPVTGKVLVGGQPAEGAIVTFYAASEEMRERKVPPPTATVDASGAFRLSSYEPDDGAPAGEFKVTIVWHEPPPPNAVGVFAQKDRLLGRYTNPQTSALTARIEQGGGELPPFQLQ
jgi:hypothetical protein